jgi:DNA-binding IclR family transcriptional regulator
VPRRGQASHDAEPGPRPGRGLIGSLRKGVELLFLFSQAEPALSLQEIAARLAVPRSSAHRLVATLRSAALVVQDPASRRYRLGARLLRLPSAVVGPADLRTLALPFMRELVERSGETAHLTERRGARGVIVEVVESPHTLRMAPRRGESFPLHAGALGRAILAGLPPRDQSRIVAAVPRRRLAPNTPTTPAALRRLLRSVQQAGYAVSIQEVTPGACGVSVPLVGPDGWAVGSLGVSGPMPRLTPERREALVEPLRKAAAEIAAALRGQPRDP